MSSRRAQLQTISSAGASHAGLWLEKFSRAVADDTDAKRTLVSEAALVPEPPGYRLFFERHKAALREAGASLAEATVSGRMVIGLGAEGVLETAITLHRTYGVPYLPGSALKGLASSYAHRLLEGEGWRKAGKNAPPGEAHRTLFGDTTSAGYVTFFDALYVPGSGHGKRALWPDVLTVHHPDYYTKDTGKPPADWDSPTPVPFMSATGSYLVALAGPQEWVSTAHAILEMALAREGIGAKTSSGYGRLTLGSLTLPPEPNQAELDAISAAAQALADGQGLSSLAELTARLEGVVASAGAKAAVANAIEKARQRIIDRDRAKLADLENRVGWLKFGEIPRGLGPLAAELIALATDPAAKRDLALTMLGKADKHPEAKALKKQGWYGPLQQLAAGP